MKIIGPDGTPPVAPGVGKPAQAPNQAEAFKKLLDEAAGKTNASGPVTDPRRLAEPRAVNFISSAAPETTIIDQTRRVIDLMNAYASNLADPEKTLKDVEPLLTQFLDAAQSVHDEYKDKAAGSNLLAGILNDLLRTAHLEQIRFQRGDYVDG